MTGDDPFANLPEAVRRLLEGGGRKLENFQSVIGTRTFAVVTYRFSYDDRLSHSTPPRVIKFSSRENSVTQSTRMRLGSSRYYREYEGEIAGIADPEEGRLVQKGSLGEFRSKNSLSPQAGADNVSTTVTWARNDFLMFCTSIFPAGSDFPNLRSQFKEYDCATVISDPSAFAMQLGTDVGKQFDLENVRQSSFDEIRRMSLKQAELTTQYGLLKKGLDTIVSVTHGPVAYCDPPERIINRFPLERRGEVVPFVKRQEYAGQQEYRFVVEVIGEPREKAFLMEITDELRSLAQVHPGW